MQRSRFRTEDICLGLQAHPLLHEPFAGQRRITRLDADRGSSADAIEEFVAVEYRLHSELRQELTVEGAGQIELLIVRMTWAMPLIPIMVISVYRS